MLSLYEDLDNHKIWMVDSAIDYKTLPKSWFYFRSIEKRGHKTYVQMLINNNDKYQGWNASTYEGSN